MVANLTQTGKGDDALLAGRAEMRPAEEDQQADAARLRDLIDRSGEVSA